MPTTLAHVGDCGLSYSLTDYSARLGKVCSDCWTSTTKAARQIMTGVQQELYL